MVDKLKRPVRLSRALALGHFHEEELFLGEIAVERGFRDAGRPGNVVNAGAFETVTQKDHAGARDNLVVFASPFRAFQ